MLYNTIGIWPTLRVLRTVQAIITTTSGPAGLVNITSVIESVLSTTRLPISQIKSIIKTLQPLLDAPKVVLNYQIN